MLLWFVRNLFGLPVTFVFGFNTGRLGPGCKMI
jgi:hypothetical protein